MAWKTFTSTKPQYKRHTLRTMCRPLECSIQQGQIFPNIMKIEFSYCVWTAWNSPVVNTRTEQRVGWNYLFLPKPLTFGNGWAICPIHHNGWNYVSILGLKLIHVSKRGHGWDRNSIYLMFKLPCQVRCSYTLNLADVLLQSGMINKSFSANEKRSIYFVLVSC